MDTKEQPSSAGRSAGAGIGIALGLAGLGLAVIVAGVAIYLFVQVRQAKRDIAALQAQAEELGTQSQSHERKTRDLDNGLAEMRSQTATIAERTGMTEAELERTAAAARQLREQQRKGEQNLASLGGEVGKVKEDVEASKAAIEETLAKLQRVAGDLGEQSGLIARNAQELAALKTSNLRDYFEFDLRKSKQAGAVGPVAIRVRDVDVKRHKFSMHLIVDDVEIEKKDKTLLEPVQFYRKGSRQLHEIVVYSVQKDRLVGYLSTPKAAGASASAQ